MPTLETHNGYPLWQYIPSRPAAIIFAVLFACVTVSHVYKLFRTRMWFCIPFVIGGIFETIGYVGRIIAYDKTGELLPYILQSILLLLAPILFAASLYMTLGRTIRSVNGDQYSLVSPRWLTRIFVTGDVVSFMIQGGGAGILVKADSKDSQKTGENVIIGGLIFQIIIFGVFICAALVFNFRFKRGSCNRLAVDGSRRTAWQATLLMLYATSVLVMIRNIFRVVEYAMGQDGYLLSHEWTVYVFDGVLMFFTMICFALRYPNRLYGPKGGSMDMELIDSDEQHRSKARV